MYYYFFVFFALPYINKPTGTWRSGGADGNLVYVLRGICRNIVGEEQHGMAKVACLRKCRYGPRAELSPSSKGGPRLDIQRRSIPEETEQQGPRRAAKRKEGFQVNLGPREGYPPRPGQPSGSCPARDRRVPKILRDNGRVSANGFEDRGKTD